MQFNLLIKEVIEQLLLDNGFILREEMDNYLKYASNTVEITFSYDPRSLECNYFIKRLKESVSYEGNLIEKYLEIVEEPIFGPKTSQEKITFWIKQRKKHISSFKDKMLGGSKDFYGGLRKFSDEENRKYNERLK